MKVARVLFVTVLGPGGQVDVAAREDVRLSQLVAAVAGAIGSGSGAAPLAIWRAAARDASPGGERTAVDPDHTLVEVGAIDGDILVVESTKVPALEEAL